MPDPYDNYQSDEGPKTEEEREEFLKNIEDYISKHRSRGSTEAGTFNPEKSGRKLPILVNALSIASILAVLSVAFFYFTARQENMMQEAHAYFSAEGKILEAYKQETEEKLRLKDNQIRKIQEKLNLLDGDLTTIVQDMEVKYKQREETLREKLEQDMIDEQVRLSFVGTPHEEIEKLMEDFRKEREKEYESQLNQYRQEIENINREREYALLQDREQTEQMLDDIEKERHQLQVLLEDQKLMLRRKFEQEREVLQSRTTQAELRFNTLAKQKEHEQLVIDQIVSLYHSIIDNIENGDYAEAEKNLNILREVLLDPEMDSVPSIKQRREIELFITDALLEIVRTTPDSEESKQLKSESARLLMTIRDTIISADEMYEEGQFDEALVLLHNAAQDLLPPEMEVGDSRYSKDISVESIDQTIERYIDETSHVESEDQNMVVAALEILQKSLRRIEFLEKQDNEIAAALKEQLDELQRHTYSLEQQQQHMITLEEQEGIAENQIMTYQASIWENMKIRNYYPAKRDLGRLKRYVMSDTYNAIPSMQQRRDHELRIIESMEKIIEESLPKPEDETTENTLEEPASIDLLSVHLLGTLLSISGMEAVVEPFTDMPLEYGSPLLIKRPMGSEGKIDIAAAEIVEISIGHVQILFTHLPNQSLKPRESDLVYTAVQRKQE
jgi:hypothetical protein